MDEPVSTREEQLRAERFWAAVVVGYEQANRGEVVPWTPKLADELRREARWMAREGRKPDPDVCP